MSGIEATQNKAAEVAQKAAPQILVIAMLLWALVPGNPYGYYILLRWVCCGVFAYLAFQAFQNNRQGWVWVLAITAGIYNPIMPVELGREVWPLVNITTIGIAVWTIFTLCQFRIKLRATDSVDRNNQNFATHKESNTNETYTRPWIRFWARLLDNWMFAFFGGFTIAMAAPTDFHALAWNSENEIWFGMASLFVWVFVEAFLLTTFGTTPGKWLFRIKLVPSSGSVLPFSVAISRSISVWWRGLGTGFPFVAFFTQCRAYSRLKERGKTSWDEDENITVTHERIGVARGTVGVALLIGCQLLVSWPQPSENSQLTFEQVAQQLADEEQAIMAVSSIQKLRRASMNGEKLSAAQAFSPPKAHGAVERFTNNFFDQIWSLQNEYKLELDTIGADSLLDPIQLNADRKLVKSRYIVERGRMIIDMYEEKWIALFKRSIMGNQIPTMSESDKNEMLSRLVVKLKRQWQLEREVAQQFEDIFQILGTTDWRVDGEKLVFAQDSDREAYQSHISRIQQIASEQKAASDDTIAEANREFELLKVSMQR